MPNAEKTPRQTIRVEKDLWEKAGRVLGERNRGAVIRDFLRWVTRETDEQPQRPDEAPRGEPVEAPAESPVVDA